LAPDLWGSISQRGGGTLTTTGFGASGREIASAAARSAAYSEVSKTRSFFRISVTTHALFLLIGRDISIWTCKQEFETWGVENVVLPQISCKPLLWLIGPDISILTASETSKPEVSKMLFLYKTSMIDHPLFLQIQMRGRNLDLLADFQQWRDQADAQTSEVPVLLVANTIYYVSI
jgi:hypothetical protein